VNKNSLFKEKIYSFYQKNKRDLPWRKTRDPYKILVSEIMLQQTQVPRVLEKYPLFLKRFPNFKALEKSSIEQVLRIWQGLGYNRRALYLKKIAEKVQKNFGETIPKDPDILQTFPGIGTATASSIIVFSFNTPLVFIETNIRRVYIHEFFQKQKEVHDKELVPLIEKTLDRVNPREWYYALMDYGSYLGKAQVNPNRRSAHYAKQSKFEGSLRQLRGKILKELLRQQEIKKTELEKRLKDKRLNDVIEQLKSEGFILQNKQLLTLVR